MRTLFRLASWMFVYTCVGTVITLLIGAGYLWSTGMLNSEKTFKILAVVHDVSLETEDEAKPREDQPKGPQPSYSEIETARDIAKRQLELKTQALVKASEDVRVKRVDLERDRDRLQTLASSFDARLEQLEEAAKTEGRTKQRLVWTKVNAVLAKDQIMNMVDQDEIDEVVAVLSDMPVKDLAKIISQFKESEEIEAIDDVMRKIRQGSPTTELIDQTYEVMQENPQEVGQ